MEINKALPEDHVILTAITKRSKNHWGYGLEQIELWKEDLTISESYIQQHQVYKISQENIILGYYSYFEIDANKVKLDNLFIDPIYIGKGIGKLLMNDFFKRVNKENYLTVTLDADPNATDFYSKLGFEIVGKLPTSIEGRYLPIMEKEL